MKRGGVIAADLRLSHEARNSDELSFEQETPLASRAKEILEKSSWAACDSGIPEPVGDRKGELPLESTLEYSKYRFHISGIKDLRLAYSPRSTEDLREENSERSNVQYQRRAPNENLRK